MSLLSQFINRATGKALQVDHGVETFTTDIQAAQTRIGDDDVILIDTPGFDSTKLSQAETVRIIAEFLQQIYCYDKRITGMIYVHPIDDNRMDVPRERSYKLFRKLCGDDAMSNVAIVTTMWDSVGRANGEVRERELETIYFKDSYERGVPFLRHDNTLESATQILAELVKRSAKTLSIQRQMVIERRSIEETDVWQELLCQLGEAEKAGVEKLIMTQGERELELVRKELQDVRAERDNLRMVLNEDLSAHLRKIMYQFIRLSNPEPRGIPPNEPLERSSTPAPLYFCVLGATGSGKTTLINHLAGSNLPVGDHLDSCTTAVQTAQMKLEGKMFAFVDTPAVDTVEADKIENYMRELVIGKTGTGKTTFINLAADSDLEVSSPYSVEQCTTNIQWAECEVTDGMKAILYDIPDIEELNETDAAVVEHFIVPDRGPTEPAWDAIIYVIDISQPRANLCRDRNYQLLDRLKQRGLLGKLSFLTTMWPEDRMRRPSGQGMQYEGAMFEAERRLTDFRGDGQQAKEIVRTLLTQNRNLARTNTTYQRAEGERLERSELERERREREAVERNMREQQRLERERQERERQERERLERKRLDQDRERQEREVRERERERLERERQERERQERERQERERQERERQERERLEQERLEQERLERGRLERERQEQAQQRQRRDDSTDEGCPKCCIIC
ncbi:hypothetical protein DAEQUDRAFT_807874 [Daedalea quercina L-15889]|uniref:G domain-containing protein n=1 Tax=Daedalea quercina L-15889 TaxID=1314783 RepID=A0A165U072_9APHY|nr:hypothetical protein DAEQUDRAFT_807874 [Daedalea quercina L-15889]